MNSKVLFVWNRLPRSAQGLIVLSLLLTLLALLADVVRITSMGQHSELGLWSEWLRFGRTVACALVCLACLNLAHQRRDAFLLALACLLCIPADFYLILARDLKTGMAIFFVVQVLLALRHGLGCVWQRLLALRYTLASLLTLLLYAVGNALLYPLLAPKGLAVPVLAYSAVLLLACLSAWCLTSNPRYPRLNAQLAFLGMVLFVLCDITVGAGAALQPAVTADWIRAATGLFYTPSLLLLAISASLFKTH